MNELHDAAKEAALALAKRIKSDSTTTGDLPSLAEAVHALAHLMDVYQNPPLSYEPRTAVDVPRTQSPDATEAATDRRTIDPSTEHHEAHFTEEAIDLIRAAKPLVDYLKGHRLFCEYVAVSAINGVTRLSECYAVPADHKWLN